MPASAALDHADRLRHASNVLRELDMLDASNRVGVDLGDPGTPPEVSVHACQPEQLDVVQARYSATDTNIDADGILRWIEVEHFGVTLTFYRR